MKPNNLKIGICIVLFSLIIIFASQFLNALPSFVLSASGRLLLIIGMLVLFVAKNEK